VSGSEIWYRYGSFVRIVKPDTGTTTEPNTDTYQVIQEYDTTEKLPGAITYQKVIDQMMKLIFESKK